MTVLQNIFTNDLYTIILCVFAFCILSVPIFIICKKKENRKLFLSCYLLLLLWITRTFVNVYGHLEDTEGLNLLEKTADGFIHALQTFSMDENYTDYTSEGKTIIESYGWNLLASIYGIFISIINICAPVLGGALLLDILTGLFPRISISLRPFRHKYVFSDLNEASVCLAEDIMRDNNYKKLLNLSRLSLKPLIIFADVNAEDNEIAGTELYSRAKRLGAVCVKNDVTDLKLSKSKFVTYLLLNESPEENVVSLSNLLSVESENILWPRAKSEQKPCVGIYVFIQDDHEAAMVKSIIEQNSNSDNVIVRVIRDYMNAAINLMCDTPLFLPLIESASTAPDSTQHLYITILGSGNIAEEVFKAVYWCGQMVNVKLHINVISRDAKRMENDIKEKYTELLECCEHESEKLKIYPYSLNKVYSPPYVEEYNFTDTDDIKHISGYPEGVLEKTDCCVIALGSDELNIAMSYTLRNALEKRALVAGTKKRRVIVPAVFSSALARSIKNINQSSTDAYVIPFATFEQRYSCKNIFMADFTEDALTNANLYGKDQEGALLKDEYKYWANIAKTVHAPYKLFSLGLLERVELDKEKFYDRYVVNHSALIGEEQDPASTGEEQNPAPISKEQDYKVAWMEHRRWNAFLRAQGFSCPSKDEFNAYYVNTRDHKNVKLKLHPCLVECEEKPKKLPETHDFNKSEYDALDFVTMYVYSKQQELNGKPETYEGLLKKDFKQYDYSEYDSALLKFLQK